MSDATLDATIPCSLSASATVVPHQPAVMGYVRDIRRAGALASELTVLMADRSVWTTRVPFTPDPVALAAQLPAAHRPLAVRIELDGPEGRRFVTCSSLASTPSGPRMVRLSPAAALALVDGGRHTLLVRRRSGCTS